MHVKTNKTTTHLISVLGLHEETRPGGYNTFLMLKAELSGSVEHGMKSHHWQSHYAASLSKTLYPLLNTVSTQ